MWRPRRLDTFSRVRSDKPRRFWIESFGCQMNDYDVERMTETLTSAGYEQTLLRPTADLVIINTCNIREKAERKTASAAGLWKEWRRDKPGAVLAIGGCVPSVDGDGLLKSIPHADFVFNPDAIPRIAEMADEALATRRRFTATAFIDVEDYDFLDARPVPGKVGVTALVTIQKGCDNGCAYCVVPKTRGREVSRPLPEVVAEVARFVQAGAKEVTLIGQNVNSYHGAGGGSDDFATLLAAVGEVAGLERIRYTTSHPKDVTPKVSEAFRDVPKLCEWMHLPVQSGSARVLAAMRREYTPDEYRRKLDYARACTPDLSITSDIIVGYPGETEADFRMTMALVEDVRFDGLYSFQYSPRPGTPAFAMDDDVPDAEKRERLGRLQELQQSIGRERLSRFVGRVEPVLVEGVSSRSPDHVCGRARGNQVINAPLPSGIAAVDLIGRTVSVQVVAARAHTLAGEIQALS